MSGWQELSVQRKLTWVSTLTCSAVLLIACAALATHELLDSRRALARDMTVLGDVLAKNTRAALAFRDEAAARETLEALQAEPHVTAACLYTASGHFFAAYTRAGQPPQFPERPEADGSRFEAGKLVLFRPVELSDKRIGTIYMQVDLERVYGRLRVFGGVSVLILAVSVGVGLALSSRLQRPISRPIELLTETARRIADGEDYSVRAPPQGQGEMGVLTGAFNQMLSAIQEREQARRDAHEALHDEVAERQHAEDTVRAQVARLELLQHVTRAIGQRQDLRSIFQVVIGTLDEHLPVDFGCVCVHEPTEGALVVSSVGGRAAPGAEAGLGEARLDAGESGLARCVQGEFLYEPAGAAGRFPFLERFGLGPLQALVAAPLRVESEVFGILVAARREPHSFTPVECEFLRQLSEHAALAARQAQVYQALQQAYDELRETQQAIMQQERLRVLGQMASGIAHDINNAISPVALYTESLLESEPGLSPRTREYLQTIQHAIDDVSATVARMREFYRSREPQLALAPVALNDLVHQVLDLTRAHWRDIPQQRGVVIALSTELDPNLPGVMGVESEIRDALTNLVINAVDSMPSGGALTVRTRVVEETRADEHEAPSHLALVEVVDTGVGMDEDTRSRCLEPFFTTKGERGTGLGLAMVYGMVQRHSADIQVESQPGAGTTVRLGFAVPLLDPPAALEQEPARLPSSRLHILVVDDDPMLLRSLHEILQREGHAVVTAGGGQAGLDAFREAIQKGEPFSVVITDLGMPHVDGRRVARGVKEASPDTPVLLLTGWGKRILAEGSIPPHVDRVLSKPPRLRDLREALANCEEAAR